MSRWGVSVGKAAGAVLTGGAVVLIATAAVQGPDDASRQEGATMGAYQAPADLDTGALRGPEQPIFFRHDIHAGQYQIDCQYCHAYAELGPSPGLPSTALCMGCHQIVGTQRPEVQKLQQAARDGQPIEWIEVYPMRQFVHFPHNRHVVNGGLACETCHGQVDRMARVWQVPSLKMGWCISCHERSAYADRPDASVTTDCTACHY